MATALARAALCSRRRDVELRRLGDHMYEHHLDADRALQASVAQPIRDAFERIERHASDIQVLADRVRTFVKVELPPDIQLPHAFTEAYELLWCQAYGTGSISMGDYNKIHDSGKAFRGRWDSDQVEKRGGAIEKRKLSSSRKNVIKNQRAYHEKIKLDKRLRKMAKDLIGFMNDEAKRAEWYMRCSKCKHFCEDSWMFCPRCGAKTERVSDG